MPYRKVVKALKANGCTSRQGKGDHEIWACPDGKHKAAITQTKEVSPGVLRDLTNKLSCLPKGWLQ